MLCDHFHQTRIESSESLNQRYERNTEYFVFLYIHFHRQSLELFIYHGQQVKNYRKMIHSKENPKVRCHRTDCESEGNANDASLENLMRGKFSRCPQVYKTELKANGKAQTPESRKYEGKNV